MASGKRASMREGPLAALFRKTEEEGLEPGGERRPEDAEAETRELTEKLQQLRRQLEELRKAAEEKKR